MWKRFSRLLSLSILQIPRHFFSRRESILVTSFSKLDTKVLTTGLRVNSNEFYLSDTVVGLKTKEHPYDSVFSVVVIE